MENNKLGERVSSLEAVSELQEKRIEKIEDRQEMLHRLTINQETLTQLVKDNQENMKEFSSTINNVNLNLTRLNTSSDELRNDVNNLENELKDVKERNEEVDDKGKFDVVDFLSKDIPKYIGMALLGAVLYYIGWVK